MQSRQCGGGTDHTGTVISVSSLQYSEKLISAALSDHSSLKKLRQSSQGRGEKSRGWSQAGTGLAARGLSSPASELGVCDGGHWPYL